MVEDRHWDAWAIPEKLVVLAKIEAGPPKPLKTLKAGKAGGPKKSFRRDCQCVSQ